jgi:hypothetical protein
MINNLSFIHEVSENNNYNSLNIFIGESVKIILVNMANVNYYQLLLEII